MKQIWIWILLLCSIGAAKGQGSSTAVKQENVKPGSDPAAARIVTSDIELFWQAYDLAKPDNDLFVYRDQYLRNGSAGLKDFTRRRISSSCGLVDAIEKHPRYYAALRQDSLKVASYKNPIRATFVKLKELYPEAVFPDVYFLIGRLNSGGKATDAGLLIGVDMFGRNENAPLEEMDEWHKAVLKPIEEIPYVVAHELIHYQQKYPRRPDGQETLLQQAINEGSADFIAELIAGHHINEQLHVYGNAHEKDLWLEFQKDMSGTDASNWLYQGDKAKGHPADLGYYIGYKICEAYYRSVKDKKQAVKDILEIKDFNQFLRDSGYHGKA